jgi:molybdenum ABC transporter molybdate-binding protein
MVRLYAAGSLNSALTELAKAHEAAGGEMIDATFGPSGLLKDEIAGGADADVFASANMAHAQALHDAGLGTPVVCFARNRLCALVGSGLPVDSGNLLDRMLDPKVKLGTSTPVSDPSGDYAFAVFAKADGLRPGARATLEKKALRLTGAKDSVKPPPGRNVYGWHVAQGHADIFLTYCTNAVAASRENSGQQTVILPDALAVGADYGLAVMKGAPAGARAFAQFVLSPSGQEILMRHGFAPAAGQGE